MAAALETPALNKVQYILMQAGRKPEENNRAVFGLLAASRVCVALRYSCAQAH